ncbi:MAG: putative membrane-bound dehydrogenase-like protein, partial [Candidatus Paceibacteria bacterium]
MVKIQRVSRFLPVFLLISLWTCGWVHAQGGAESPLRIYIRAGEKTHGPGQHDHPRFLEEWTSLLQKRGAVVNGSLHFPSTEELDATDVLVMYAAEAGTIEGAEREHFDSFLQRGGGLVVVHDGVCGTDSQWFKTRAGGAWEHGHSKWLEGKVGLYFSDPHPITRGIPHFDLDDEIYYDLHMAPNAQVLANGFHDVFSISPQMWVVDEEQQRVFVTLQGHQHTSFAHPAFRTLLLRGIAWAGRRDVSTFTAANELAQLRYPPGGPIAPELAAQSLVLHDDFEVNLVAAEPLVVNPISIDWDLQGRLWVAQTPGYPYKQEFSGVAAHDEITILEDTNGDGRMDTSKAFASGLDLVTSFVFHGNGVIVTQAPDILWLRDNDQDDVADERIVLYTGFGYGDTHAVMSNLRWGLDGWIYGTQGYSGNASRDIHSPHFNAQQSSTGNGYGHIPNGIFRFQPDGSAIEPYSVYGSNTWGLDFDPSGELFYTMANGSHLRHVLLSEHELGASRLPGVRTWRDIVDHRGVFRLSKADRAPYVQIDFVGGFTAASGSMIYSGGVWPQEYEGNHFVCEPTVNLVHRDIVKRTGATYTASKPRQEEFLASTDPWFRPVQTRTGPDGSMYVLDFYNQAAVHNDTRGPQHGPTNAAKRPDRDRHHGRIWRVQHRQALATPPAGTHFWNAMRRMRGVREGQVPASELPPLDGRTPAIRVRALWAALHSGNLDSTTLQQALTDEHADVRRAAAKVAAEVSAEHRGPTLSAALGARLSDPDARVQLASLTSLSKFELNQSELEELVSNYPQLQDDWARSAFLQLAKGRLTAVLPSAIELQKNSTDLAARQAADSLVARLIEIQGREGSAEEIAQTLNWILAGGVQLAPSLPLIFQAMQGSLRAEFQFGTADEAAGEALAGLFRLHGSSVEVQSALLPIAARVKSSRALEES